MDLHQPVFCGILWLIVMIMRLFMKQFAIDNSAILYLALIRRHHTNIFRFSLTLKEQIQPELLQ